MICSQKNILKLNVYFEALNYETITQKKAYEISDLLGTITVLHATGQNLIVSFR